ncbi:putative F-box domain, galactose oxidase/kelch, beta-propeller, kelch-type beta propeller [Helianthus annuus]|nr:putative F-box domain, galactose oxidase/kelch, beta-propeller, kelch-type beta propeller [Helianthus annuus]KAJ0738683.1 putative F-box domain, galactose oxidase/kelch, beta-propeller, kelch-type beta propeller [Helianthus annuus]KAJ0741568.1 putative F-box domain, galactose oxidase/kelch, beta-propeller, kelch-type beta propeller [Helianthus annuus]
MTPLLWHAENGVGRYGALTRLSWPGATYHTPLAYKNVKLPGTWQSVLAEEPANCWYNQKKQFQIIMADDPTSSNHLPPELIIDIFLRLPVKTLIRCTSVCKQCPNRKYSLNFIGSSNGLLCLAPGLEYTLGNDVYIWNPSVRACKKLPVSRFSDHEFRGVVSRLGFAFHESSNDYKVVRLVYFSGSCSFPFVDVVPLVEIYSLRTDSWKVVSAEVPPVMIQSVATFNDGVFYWMGFKSVTDDPMENYILSYDLDDGRFREIEQPSVDFPFSLLAVKGSSSGSLYSVYSKFFGGQNDILVLWKMDEFNGGWMKAYTIQCNRGVWATLGFTTSGKFLFANLEKKLVSFDLETLETEVHDLGIALNRSAVDVNYMESLLFFDL